MRVAGHQCDLLPYSGFWYKVAKADVFDVRIEDQFLRKGYQRRVLMRDKWASIPVREHPSRSTPICEVRLVDGAPRALADIIIGRYRGSRYFAGRGDELVDRILDVGTDRLWQFNFDLLLHVRDMLRLNTPFSISPAPVGQKGAGIVSVMRRFGPDANVWLSGTGARSYMGDCREFTDAGLTVEWSRHKPVTGDSIVTVLMDRKDPLDVVMAEEPGPAGA